MKSAMVHIIKSIICGMIGIGHADVCGPETCYGQMIHRTHGDFGPGKEPAVGSTPVGTKINWKQLRQEWGIVETNFPSNVRVIPAGYESSDEEWLSWDTDDDDMCSGI